MNALTNFTTAKALTMSSREIADLTGKLHAHVLRDIRSMLDDLGEAESKFGSSYVDGTGRTLPLFNLPHRETMILVMGYSIPMRARVVDRWQELEEAAKGPALPNFGSPAEAARAWALEFERAEEQARLVAAQAAKVEALTEDQATNRLGHGRAKADQLQVPSGARCAPKSLGWDGLLCGTGRTERFPRSQVHDGGARDLRDKAVRGLDPASTRERGPLQVRA
ncbi:Rha family transcriptional regulator [Ideonella sp. B508-1]|uniref:Rha family transcriptional regulator n=1 Tax=Ideonella sp. B508-1 TaxID=137716 RepID=UPI0003B5A622|nr:Rha family transcriptional regulator [Ideonella sp. B508-1]